ncbi:MAG: yodB2 [Frankiales bacterium]|nr:yodB2 [Frankiales bacterium]
MEHLDPGTLPGRPCSAAAALSVVGDRWALLAIREVSLGNRRFSEIVRNTGAPRDRLTVRLNGLVEAGVLEKRPYSTSPPRSDYHLTEAGRDLLPVLQALLAWGDKWVVSAPVAEFRHTDAAGHEHRADLGWTCRTCGEPAGRVRWTSLRDDWDRAGPVAAQG